ncbi:lipid-binding SYLF domain-containing protein [Noviherbaspirillum sp. ST9]|uniref:lipid-binding SYLF domain-containing protein n=1 Tax=Noviherbaspirillum sp. ST9 TaxID=3401606 RepID=UPI003B5892EB
MMTKTPKTRMLALACALALGSPGSAALAQASESSSGASRSGSAASSAPEDTMQQINNATRVVKRMETDPQLKKMLHQAKGVFIVPQYARGGLTVGVRGGEGVLLVNNNGKWSNPAFYNFGGMSVGAQAGAEVGSIAMMLMNQKAVDNFMQENKFSLTADAGLTIVDYEAKAKATAGRGDIVVWSDTKGAFAGAVIGVTDINFDNDENAAFYKSGVTAKDIVGGKVKNAQAKSLTQELSSGQ